MLIVMAGLPASGKSAVAAVLRKELEAVLLDKDVIRACLFDGHVDYERQQDDLCVNVMYEVASYHVKRHPGTTIILDGRTYSRRYQIEAVKQVASALQVPLRILECVCSVESARERLAESKGIHLAGDRDFSLHQKSRRKAEPINEPKQVLDTDALSLAQCSELALQYIRSLPS